MGAPRVPLACRAINGRYRCAVTDNDYVIDPVKGPRVVPTHERALAPVQSPATDRGRLRRRVPA